MSSTWRLDCGERQMASRKTTEEIQFVRGGDEVVCTRVRAVKVMGGSQIWDII